MTDENEYKQREAGKADSEQGELENYDVGKALRTVRHLGNGLMESTEGAKHYFRKMWLEQLIRRYEQLPGKPVVRLSDLEDSVILTLDPSVSRAVAEYCEKLVTFGHSEETRRHFRNITDIVKAGNSKPARLRTWMKFSALTGFPINTLEPYILSLRISEGPYNRTIDKPKLPICLATPTGARIFGYRGDANYWNSAFTNKDPLLHEDYRNAIRNTVGDISFSQTRLHSSGFTQDTYIRTNVGRFITRVTTVAGLDNSKRQKLTNNPAPLWFFMCREEIIASYLAALWDAEGSINRRDLKLTQAVGLKHISATRSIPPAPDDLPAGQLENRTLDQIYRHPPRLLTSAALLLFALGIVAHIEPTRVTRTKQDFSVYWQLRIIRDRFARTFREKVKLRSPHKLQRLDAYLQSTKRPSPPPFFYIGDYWFRAETRVIMKKNKRKRTIYASLYRIPEEDKLKAHLIFIVNERGKVEDYLPGPFTIGEYFGSRLKRKYAAVVVCSYLRESYPRMVLRPEDVKLYSYRNANRLLFELQNK